MRQIKKYFKYIIGIIILALLLILGYYFLSSNQKISYDGLSNSDTTPVPIANWALYSSTYGFSFMHPTNLKVEENEDELAVGGIIVKIERLNCVKKISKKEIVSGTTLYGFRAGIDEPNKTAYICNNTKTACLDIATTKTKITEGFFHSFISSLNLTEDFDKISCVK